MSENKNYSSTFKGINDIQREFIEDSAIGFNAFFLLAIKEKIEKYPELDQVSLKEVRLLRGKKKDMQMYPIRDVPKNHMEFIENTNWGITSFFLMAIFEKIKRDSI